MTTNHQDNICPRCQNREKFLETFKKCLYCSKKHCNQCWTELHESDDYKLLKLNNTNPKRICSICIKNLLQYTLKTSENNEDDDYQLALALSLSQNEVDKKRKFDENKDIQIKKVDVLEKKLENNNGNLLEQTAEAIERFMNRAKSNCELKS